MEFFDSIINFMKTTDNKALYLLSVAAFVILLALLLRSLIQASMIIGIMLVVFIGFSIITDTPIPDIKSLEGLLPDLSDFLGEKNEIPEYKVPEDLPSNDLENETNKIIDNKDLGKAIKDL